jgi:KDO2-lipid IV(A) lauroyltransferase
VPVFAKIIILTHAGQRQVDCRTLIRLSFIWHFQTQANVGGTGVICPKQLKLRASSQFRNPVTKATAKPGYFQFLHPKYWLLWTGICVAWLIAQLPFSVKISIGNFLGSIGYRFAQKRRHIVETNIRLCFPKLNAEEHQELVQNIFRSSGISIVETATAWYSNPASYQSLFTIKGEDILRNAVAEGHGVLLLGMHFSTLDISGAVVGSIIDMDVMYRKNKNPLFDLLMKTGREKHFDQAISRDDIRTIIKRLKSGRIIWYGTDQDYGRKHSVFAPFFRVPTATITATARFARMSGANIVFITHFRNKDDTGYEIEFSRPLDHYPTGDDVEDATSINKLVEAAILRHPEQYWWLHKRFKTRPEGEKSFYRSSRK